MRCAGSHVLPFEVLLDLLEPLAPMRLRGALDRVDVVDRHLAHHVRRALRLPGEVQQRPFAVDALAQFEDLGCRLARGLRGLCRRWLLRLRNRLLGVVCQAGDDE
jgi:hypothetical protein